ncbi:uncharacterized protein BO72DRAFT_451286 [Aspergillus fijiensis CBS 313.89]|uniref:Uncharacterized protein n=1 Tax=Aspergillus fijiensis CBS 313.89 TaxID=1448319 RepID=A0A8G1RHF1_9EURO|nr:uncharacterized protein BO72DRAFT_451286 [Aspergillus fijiensis CBS 313.89]RAK73957.1 hypothetical protein BO72DRAFT_451286 [Aspergillus fijiensis CBS 313.89]
MNDRQHGAHRAHEPNEGVTDHSACILRCYAGHDNQPTALVIGCPRHPGRGSEGLKPRHAILALRLRGLCHESRPCGAGDRPVLTQMPSMSWSRAQSETRDHTTYTEVKRDQGLRSLRIGCDPPIWSKRGRSHQSNHALPQGMAASVLFALALSRCCTSHLTPTLFSALTLFSHD